MYLLVIWRSSLEKIFSSSVHFCNWIFVCLLLSCMGSSWFWILTPYMIYGLQIFSPFYRLCFHFKNCFFYCAEAFSFDIVLFVDIHVVVWTFGIISKKSLPSPMSKSFFPMISSRGFTVSSLTFKSLIHQQLIFMSGVTEGSKISFSCMSLFSFLNTIY